MKKQVICISFVLVPLIAFAQHDHTQMASTVNSAMPYHGMRGFYGGYPITREASGTSWQPESAPMSGVHFEKNAWDIMAHGFVSGVYDYQGGKRGDEKAFSASMFMIMASRETAGGMFGFRGMFSLDPLMGDRGYPLLFQTGETYDGIHPLVDRQHPHDLFMEEAVTYSMRLSEKNSLFGYFGLPGEPALGPPAFMHRFSGMENPEAPLGHHWLDSTHITYGVCTLGFIVDSLKIEGSAFHGREPDEYRYDIESPKLDSYAGRVSWNPWEDISFQLSYGFLDSPEQLEPSVDVARTTASMMYNRVLLEGNWQTMFAWGKNNKNHGLDTNAYLIESALRVKKAHTFFSRFEYVEKDELFEHDDALAGKDYDVKKLTVGYVYDFPEWKHLRMGVGASLSFHWIPDQLDEPYSESPKSYLLFTRIKL